MKDSKLTVNILPQSSDAWWAIAFAVMCLSACFMVRGCTDAIARETEARYAAEAKSGASK